MNTVQVRPISILLIEDDEADVLLARRAITRANIWNKMYVARNGQEGLDYLHHEGVFADPASSPTPGVILLDLNLPGISGRDFLDRIYQDERFKGIPVVIVSTSDYESDLEFGRARGVKHYVIKPMRSDNVIEVLMALDNMKIILGTPES